MGDASQMSVEWPVKNGLIVRRAMRLADRKGSAIRFMVLTVEGLWVYLGSLQTIDVNNSYCPLGGCCKLPFCKEATRGVSINVTLDNLKRKVAKYLKGKFVRESFEK